MYRVVTIEKIEAPLQNASNRWYRFVITNDKRNTITGLRAGTRKEVTQFAIDCVNHLNHKYRFSKQSATKVVRAVNVALLGLLSP